MHEFQSRSNPTVSRWVSTAVLTTIPGNVMTFLDPECTVQGLFANASEIFVLSQWICFRGHWK